MKMITANSLGELATLACNICKNGPVENLLLTGTFTYKSVKEEPLIIAFIDYAKKWQEKTRPNDLVLNHGEYIYKCGDAINYISEQLTNKRAGNRACISLVDMDDIIKSSDISTIPSLLLIQFGFIEGNNDKLLVTVYFRALEVSEHLPINLAEISHLVGILRNKFPNINTFELHLFAFRAQYIPNFHCLKKSKIDLLKQEDIDFIVKEENKSALIDLLKNKISCYESVIDTNGLSNLNRAINAMQKFKFLNNELEKIINELNDLKSKRESTSIHSVIKDEYEDVYKKIQDLIKTMEAAH